MITVEENELLKQLQSKLLASEREVQVLEARLRVAWTTREELRRVITTSYGPGAARVPTPLPPEDPPKPRRTAPKAPTKKGPTPTARWAALSPSAQRTLRAIHRASDRSTDGVRSALAELGDVQSKQAVLMRLRRLHSRGVVEREDSGPWAVAPALRSQV